MQAHLTSREGLYVIAGSFHFKQVGVQSKNIVDYLNATIISGHKF